MNSESAPIPEALDRADWTRPSAIYRQCLDIAADDRNYLPPALTGFLAEIVARISPSYYGFERELVRDAVQAFAAAHRDDVGADVTTMLRSLYFDDLFMRRDPYSVPSSSTKRRRPTPVEATVETTRRLRDLRDIEHALSPITIGAALGGSVSYGRFYNVLGNAHGAASDIDLLVVVEGYGGLIQLGHAMSEIEYVGESECADFVRRAEDFLDHRIAESRYPIAFSGKFKLWESSGDPILDGSDISGGYNASLHVVSDQVFSELVFSGQSKITRNDLGESRPMFDFRESEPVRDDYQRSFSGQGCAIHIGTERSGDSFLRSTKMFSIDEREQYYPGMFQNLIIPAFELVWGSSQLRRRIDAFRWKMIDRLRHEKNLRPDEHLRLSLSHTRSEIFSPHTIRAVDNSTLLA